MMNSNKRKNGCQSDIQPEKIKHICIDISDDEISQKPIYEEEKYMNDIDRRDISNNKRKFESESEMNEKICKHVVIDINDDENLPENPTPRGDDHVNDANRDTEDQREGSKDNVDECQENESNVDEDEEEGQNESADNESNSDEGQNESGDSDDVDDECSKAIFEMDLSNLNPDSIKSAIENKADINYFHPETKVNVGHFYFERKGEISMDVVKSFVKFGLDFNKMDDENDTPFMCLCRRRDPPVEIIKYLIDSNVVDPTLCSLRGSLLSMVLCCRSINKDLCDLILACGVKMTIEEFQSLCGSAGLTEPIFFDLLYKLDHLYCSVERIEESLCVLVNNKYGLVTKDMLAKAYELFANINITDILVSHLSNRQRPRIKMELVEYLYGKMIDEHNMSKKLVGKLNEVLSVKSGIEKPDPNSLLESIDESDLNVDILSFFLDKGAELSNDLKEVCLVKEELTEDLFFLLDKHTVSWDSKNHAFLTKLCGSPVVSIQTISIMLDKKAVIDEMDDNGNPISNLCYNRKVSLDMIKVLVENKADLNVVTYGDSYNALTALLSNENSTFEMVEYLVNNGAVLFKGSEDDASNIDCIWRREYMTNERLEWLIGKHKEKSIPLDKVLFTNDNFREYLDKDDHSFRHLTFFMNNLKKVKFPKKQVLGLFKSPEFTLEMLQKLVGEKHIVLNKEISMEICKRPTCPADMFEFLIQGKDKKDQKDLMMELFLRTAMDLSVFRDIQIEDEWRFEITRALMRNVNTGVTQMEHIVTTDFVKWKEFSEKEKRRLKKVFFRSENKHPEAIAFLIKNAGSPEENLDLFIKVNRDPLTSLFLIGDFVKYSENPNLLATLSKTVFYNRADIEKCFERLYDDGKKLLLVKYPHLSLFYENPLMFFIEKSSLEKYIEILKK